MLQRSMFSRQLCDSETRTPVAKTALQNKAAKERQGARGGDLHERGALAVFQHLTGAERRIALLDHSLVMGGVAHRVVPKIAGQRFYARAGFHHYRFMNDSITPVAASPIEKPKLIIRIPTAAADPTAQVKGAAGHSKTVG